MKQFELKTILIALGIVAACGGGAVETAGSGGAGTTTTTSSNGPTSSSTTSSSTSSSGAGGMGTGGADPCPTCIVVATLPAGSKPYGLALDDGNVYWTNAGTGEVMQAQKNGTNQITLSTGEDAPHAVAVAGGFVYWGMYSPFGKLRKAPVGGGAIVDLLASAPAVLEIAVDLDYVWWTREPDDVQRMPTAGLPEGGVEDLLTGNPLPNGIAVDASNIYWTNQQDGNVKKADRDLGNATPLAVGDVPWGVAIDTTTIYWTERGSAPNTGKVVKASKADGSGVTAIATGQASPQGIAVDDTHVYWANNGDGTINKASLAGGPATVIASMQKGPVKIALDTTYVYWTSNGGDRVVKAPK